MTTAELLSAARDAADDVDLSWLPDEAERDRWTLADDALRYVAALVDTLRPEHIVELGSGVSTVVLAAHAARLVPPCDVVSIESDPFYARQTQQALADHGTAARVEVTHLVTRRLFDQHRPVYDLADINLRRGCADFVLVDGPPLPLGGRSGSLLQAVDLARCGGIVLIDDADRESEQAALDDLRAIQHGAVEVLDLSGFKKGLAAVVIVGTTASLEEQIHV